MKAMRVSKLCYLCRRVKLLKHFYSDASRSDGLSTGCAACNRDIARQNSSEQGQPLDDLRPEEALFRNFDRAHDARAVLEELTA